MKSAKLMWLVAVAMFAVLATVALLAAQHNPRSNKHHHYQLVDLGTFGGPQSWVFGAQEVPAAIPTDPDLALQEEEAGQTLPRTTDKAHDDYLAADKILFETLPGRCLVHFETMTGYCITPSGGVCHSDYKPSFCPPGMRTKHIKTFQCATEFAYVAAHRTCP